MKSKKIITQIIEDKIIEINGLPVIIDADVAGIYDVETRDINKSVKNNPEKFPKGYIIELTKVQKNELVENFHQFNNLKHSKTMPKAFTEKGLYMLATILKSQQATQTTIAIIETFTKIRTLQKNIRNVSNAKDENEKNSFLQKSGEIIAEILDNNLNTNETETSIELNFAVLKFKHKVKKKAEN
ncbi:MAG: ORF6N domain-containing protein [bacterium]